MLITRIAVDVAKNVAMAIPAIRQARLKGARTSGDPTAEGLADRVDLLRGALDDACGGVRGKSVLEIGPGDNLCSGLALLAVGARNYTAIDRFPGNYRSDQALAWYAALAARDGPLASLDDARIRLVEGAVETMHDLGRFDIVCSRAVGEHVRSVPAFARFTRDSLAPGGTAVHIVDFSGHHWHDDGDPELFRRFPDWLWRAMGSNRGLPNRVPYLAFVSAFEDAGLQTAGTSTPTHVVLVARRRVGAPLD
jgi:hypothetical protein